MTDLTSLVEELLTTARAHASGRGGRSVRGGQDTHLHHMVLALTAGASLSEHESPGEATLLVLHGRVRLEAGDEAWDLGAGELADIPPRRHGLTALEDSAVMLTTVRR